MKNIIAIALAYLLCIVFAVIQIVRTK